MTIDILTGLPELLGGTVNSSILRNALLSGICDIWVHDLRHFTVDRHGKIDDTPYGGGPGMILSAQPVFGCLDNLLSKRTGSPKLIYLTPQGRTLEQTHVQALTETEWLILLCGHYKEVDARVFQKYQWDEVSIGDYVLSGGELPAAVLVDAIVRLLPGSLGDDLSAKTDSFSDGLLDAPYYTKPEEIESLRVPDVLLSGHHKNIAKWRQEQKVSRTKERRPDLWEAYRIANEQKIDNNK